jgi:hypothetical protein
MSMTTSQHRQWLTYQDAGIEQHADRYEEQHGERILQGQRVGRRLIAEVGFAEHDAGEECAQRERHTEQLGRAVGYAERQDRKGEQLARAGACNQLEEPRHHPGPDHDNERHEQGHLAEGDGQCRGHGAGGKLGGAAAGISSKHARKRRQQHQSEHHHEILDDQPSDRDPAVDRIERVALLQRTQQHHGACNGQRQTEH